MSSWHVEDDVWPHDKVIIAPDGTRWRLSSDEELGLLVAALEQERRRAEANAAKAAACENLLPAWGKLAGWARAVIERVRLPTEVVEQGEDALDAYEDFMAAIKRHYGALTNPDTSEAKG